MHYSKAQQHGTCVVSLASNPAGHALISPSLFETTADVFVRTRELREEAFGPAALVVRCNGLDDVARCLRVIEGSLGDEPA